MILQAYTELQLERDSLSTSYQQLTRQTEELVSQLQRERDDKIMECEQLRLKVGKREREKWLDGHRVLLGAYTGEGQSNEVGYCSGSEQCPQEGEHSSSSV